MRKAVAKVYDQQISTFGATAQGRLDAITNFWVGQKGRHSAKKWDDFLGRSDQLGLFVEVTNVSSAAFVSFDMFIDTSSDGIFWLPARGNALQLPPFHTGIGDLNLSVSSSSSGSAWLALACTGVSRATGSPVAAGPLLHYVRLFMKMSSGTAQIKVYAVQRDGQ